MCWGHRWVHWYHRTESEVFVLWKTLGDEKTKRTANFYLSTANFHQMCYEAIVEIFSHCTSITCQTSAGILIWNCCFVTEWAIIQCLLNVLRPNFWFYPALWITLRLLMRLFDILSGQHSNAHYFSTAKNLLAYLFQSLSHLSSENKARFWIQQISWGVIIHSFSCINYKSLHSHLKRFVLRIGRTG